MRLNNSGKPRRTWALAVTVVWTILLSGADLKGTIHTRIHWIASLVAVILLLPFLVRNVLIPKISRSERDRKLPHPIASWLFILSVLIPVAYGADLVLSFGDAAKLALILIVAASVFIQSPELTNFAFWGFIVAVWINSMLMVGGLIGVGGGELMSPGRWGTLMDYPGSLWRMAISVWLYSLYLVFKTKSVKWLLTCAASTFLIFMDGARTGILLCIAGAMFISVIDGIETARLRRIVFAGVVALCVGAVLVAGISKLSEGGDPDQSNGLVRVSKVFSSEEDGSGLSSADVSRYYMLAQAVSAVYSHPILGTGISTTFINTLVGPMVVHMTYLQVWADLGLLGIVTYVILVWGWLPWAPVVLRNVRHLRDPKQKALAYNALFVLFVFGTAGLFHPLSTELSEWILFLVPYAITWKFVRSKDVRIAESCPVSN